MNQKRPYKSYTAEFKEEALALISDQGYSMAEAAASLGMGKLRQRYVMRHSIFYKCLY